MNMSRLTHGVCQVADLWLCRAGAGARGDTTGEPLGAAARGAGFLGMVTLMVGAMPAVVAMSTRASSENNATLPRVRSEMRGCVTPKRAAALT